MTSSKGGFFPSLTRFFRRLFVDKPQSLTYSTSMAISIDEEYKNNLVYKITLRFADAIQAGEIPSHEMGNISRFVTGSMAKISTKEELINFLRSLAIRWSSFEDVFHHEVDQIRTANTIGDTILNRPKKT
jgi:hypothetical protein